MTYKHNNRIKINTLIGTYYLLGLKVYICTEAVGVYVFWNYNAGIIFLCSSSLFIYSRTNNRFYIIAYNHNECDLVYR